MSVSGSGSMCRCRYDPCGNRAGHWAASAEPHDDINALDFVTVGSGRQPGHTHGRAGDVQDLVTLDEEMMLLGQVGVEVGLYWPRPRSVSEGPTR